MAFFQSKIPPLSALHTFIYRQRASLLIFGLLGFWLIDVYNTAEQTLPPVLKVTEFAAEEKKTVASIAKQALSPFVSISLPIAPTLIKEVSSNEVSSASTNLTTRKHTTKKSSTKTDMLKEDKSNTAKPSEISNNIQSANRKITSEQVEEVITHLTELDSQNIQFLLPQRNVEKEIFLKHMYQCKNMQFGAVTNTKPYRLTILSSKNNNSPYARASELLRVVHDYTSSYEQSLLTLYGQEQARPVRIFPYELDMHLAAQIALQLHGERLVSFMATYFLQDSKIGLKDIVLNKTQVKGTWIISASSCS